MKKFVTVLKFELTNYIQNKSFVITTAIIAVLLAIVMFLPRFVDMSEFLGIETEDTKSTDEEEELEEDDLTQYVIYDKAGAFSDLHILEEEFVDSKWKKADSVDEVKKQVKSGDAEGGFVVNSLMKYDYYVNNMNISNMDMPMFEGLLAQCYREDYCITHGLDLEEVMSLVYVPVEGEEKVLGKDMSDSFVYCYIFVILIFMMIIMYCVMIATSVTSEKSNRSIEVLVTSTTPNSLIFGKVIAGTIASFLQVAVILGIALGGYAINRESWGNKLDMVLKIPSNVLAVFALFGVFGFVFYAFIYAAVGALCSKTEDINKTATGVQMVMMIVYFASLLQMSNIDGVLMKVLSFLPVSSYSTMFIRVAMGKVAVWEILISFVILILSTGVVGYIAAKIYRMGTLRYGNPISIRAALKSLKEQSE